jgi:hypothetical protein
MCWYSCSESDTARPIIFLKPHGGCSNIRPRAGRACRQSAISSTRISNSTTWPRVQPDRLRGVPRANRRCRDFAHLAVALCRCMNIPTRYCTGYLSDIGVPPPHSDMDFAGWFEAYLDGSWHTFDPRNNEPRIGRVLVGRGRDAVDVPLSNAFGENTLVGFKVWMDEVGPLTVLDRRIGWRVFPPPPPSHRRISVPAYLRDQALRLC